MKNSRILAIGGVIGLAGLAAFWLWLRWPFDAPRQDIQRAEESPAASVNPTGGSASAGQLRASAAATTDACPPATAAAPADVEQFKADYERRERVVNARLIESPDPEHRQAATLIERDPRKRIELLRRAMAASGDSAFFLWHAVRICAASTEGADCPLKTWESRLIALDGQNSEAWMLVAANRWSAGETDAALRALRRAATSPESRSYWPETVALLERAFAVGDFTFEERAGHAFGVAAMNALDYGKTTRMCRTQAAAQPEWANVCLAYGELVERQGKTMLETAIARAIQRIALEALGDDERLAAVIARQDEFRRQRSEELSTRFIQSGTAASTDAKFFAWYLELIGEMGEVSAMKEIAKEWDDWHRRHGNLSCQQGANP